MTRRVPNRSRRACAHAALVFLSLVLSLPCSGYAAEPFPGYPAGVREAARRVVNAAKPGLEEVLEPEIQSLRKAMFDHAILSINAIPDRIFERARKEGWKDQVGRVLRPVARVAPYSVALWAWLLREDLATFSLDRLPKDLEGLEGALRQYGPGLLGCTAWVLLFFCAAASWYVVWASISLLLRAQPALTSDLARPFKRVPRPEFFAFIAFLGCFLAPILAGVGLAVAVVFWIFLSAGYLRRWELVMAGGAILLLGAVFLCAGGVQAIGRITGETQRGGWLGGEGYYPRQWPDETSFSGDLLSGPRWKEMVKFARARAEMQSGDLAAAESMWTDWIREARNPAAGYNNRGIVRVWLGKTDEALSDFVEAAELMPQGNPAHWNAYQVYLQTFRLEDAARIQVAAWDALRGLKLFDYRAEEMTHGELVPSPLQVENVWRAMIKPRTAWFRQAMESPYRRYFFRPLTGKWVPVFLAFGWLWATMWKPLSRKVWMHSTCRACGTRTLIVGGKEASDICNPCRAQVGDGIRPGDERGQRIFNITMHRRYVRACSVAVPGAGAMWAGKNLPSMIYGALLSIPLGAITVSLGARQTASSLISDMLGGVVVAAVAAVAFLWAIGVVWGWRSFDALQLNCNIAPQR
jgi:hypothetical protein